MTDESNFEQGERVVVMNPGPRAHGRITRTPLPGERHVRVKWDDGEVGHPRIDLLRRESEAKLPPADRPAT